MKQMADCHFEIESPLHDAAWENCSVLRRLLETQRVEVEQKRKFHKT